MTQAFNLAQLANNLNTSGQLDATDGLNGLVANANLASSGSASSSTYLRGDRTWASLPALGNVLQVIQTVKTDVFTFSGFTFQTVTGLSASITPSSSTSKILITVSTYFGESAADASQIRLMRNSTPICVGDAAGNRVQTSGSSGYESNSINSVVVNFLDSPATTSSVTYSIQATIWAGTGYLNRTGADGDTGAHPRTASTITLMEIRA